MSEGRPLLLRRFQKNWIKERNYCRDAECIKDAYQIQISMLKLPSAAPPVSGPITARHAHSATLLPDGMVLLAGGLQGDEESLGSAEIFDPTTRRFIATGSLKEKRDNPTATALRDGKVLVAGGAYFTGYHAVPVASGELYDPKSGKFSPARGDFSGKGDPVLLTDGRLLFLGYDESDIYDPATGKFVAIGKMLHPRISYATVVLPDGKVLIAGGYDSRSTNSRNIVSYVGSAELFDPATRQFISTGALTQLRSSHSATLLPNGKVLIAGGLSDKGESLASTELYDPATGRFTLAGNLATPRCVHKAIPLPNGKILIAGGSGGGKCEIALSSLELYDPASNRSTTVGRFFASRPGFSATLLKDGNVLIVSGDIAELYEFSH